ncbi:MAG: hypothetical protein Q8M94_19045 [Ignavibacteria bacterium]|nr:hypothetical protein [Ignavibacteria bacterium]
MNKIKQKEKAEIINNPFGKGYVIHVLDKYNNFGYVSDGFGSPAQYETHEEALRMVDYLDMVMGKV